MKNNELLRLSLPKYEQTNDSIWKTTKIDKGKGNKLKPLPDMIVQDDKKTFTIAKFNYLQKKILS